MMNFDPVFVSDLDKSLKINEIVDIEATRRSVVDCGDG